MTFRNDVSSLRAPATELSAGWQAWLHAKLQQLDTQLHDIEQQQQALKKSASSWHITSLLMKIALLLLLLVAVEVTLVN
jgi:hypothetical protein